MDEKMLTDDVFVADPVEERLMLGNEAVAQGAWEAGLRVVASYPGTPSTEITECVARFPEVDCQWAPNEKVATEVAFGAAMAGARAMTCMKHVGVNVAADPIFTAAYTGVNAGLVVVCADDPAMHSSQNEQDSRYYARAAHIPMLEPSDSRECHAFTRLAFTMSEELDTPVFLRLTTRVAHARSVVAIGERADVPLRPYQKDAMKYVMMPGMARKRHLKPGGRMLPSRDHLFAVPAHAPHEYAHIEAPWQRNAYDVDLSAAVPMLVNTWSRARAEPARPEDLLAAPQPWGVVDYTSTDSAELDATLDWTIERGGLMHGLYAWFDGDLGEGFGYSNAPTLPELVYGRAFFPLERPVAVQPGDHVHTRLAARLFKGSHTMLMSNMVEEGGLTDDELDEMISLLQKMKEERS